MTYILFLVEMTMLGLTAWSAAKVRLKANCLQLASITNEVGPAHDDIVHENAALTSYSSVEDGFSFTGSHINRQPQYEDDAESSGEVFTQIKTDRFWDDDKIVPLERFRKRA